MKEKFQSIIISKKEDTKKIRCLMWIILERIFGRRKCRIRSRRSRVRILNVNRNPSYSMCNRQLRHLNTAPKHIDEG